MTERVDVAEGPDTGLPWHYGNPIAEQRALERGEGVVDLGNRDVLTVDGDDRLEWLNSLSTQVMDTLTPGQAVSSYILSPQGHIEFAMYGVDDGTTFWCWTEPGRGQVLALWLDSMKFMKRVNVILREDLGIIWRPGTPTGDGVHRAGADSLDGYETFVPVTRIFDEVSSGLPVGDWAWQARRIAAGVPRIGIDTDDRTIPNEVGVPSAAVALNKGCYRGQETVARVHNLGKPPRRLVRFHLDGSVHELPPLGAAVTVAGDEKSVGFLGSAAWHHELGPIGLGLVKRGLSPDAAVLVGSVDATQEIVVDPDVGEHFRPS